MRTYPDLAELLEAVPILTPILRGQPVELSRAVQAGWIVVGFGLAQGLPVPVRINLQADEAIDKAAVADTLDNLVKQSGDRQQAIALPWDVILPVLFQLLQKWLSGRG